MSLTAPTPPPPPPPPPATAYEPAPPPTEPGRSGARIALQIGAVITGVLVILAALNLFSLTAGRSSDNLHRSFALTSQALTIQANSADVTLLPSATGALEIDRRARVAHGQRMGQPELNGDVLTLPSNCHRGVLGWLWFCSVHYDVRVPAGMQLDVRAGSGDVGANGIQAASLSLHTGSGDVDITAADVPQITGDTGSGDVDGAGLLSSSTVLKTGSGDVNLTFSHDPTTVQARTGSGDVTVRVPRDGAEYYVQGRTGSGDYHNRVRSLGEAPAAGTQARFINAQTGSGDLTVEYAD
jgi:Putative adhesin